MRRASIERLEDRRLLTSLGSDPEIVGDANLDGRFDSSDLMAVFQAGRYELPASSLAGWSEGDWNGDGRFDTSDLVTAFVSGSYRQPVAADPAVVRPVVISEIMYHTADDRPAEEFIELWNLGSEAVPLQDWQFVRGIHFQFPEYSLPAGDRVVVAADLEAFQSRYPLVQNVLGNWSGGLSNRGETVELIDSLGRVVDAVRYSDQGEWATRARGAISHGHQGWIWQAAHDGDGPSLELVNAAVGNDYGQNWLASRADGGTPGAPNSVAADRSAPFILDVAHTPIIPTSNDAIRVSAQIENRGRRGTSVTLRYAVDGQAGYSELTMRDDGQQPDPTAGDGVYWAEIPPHPDTTILSFHVVARDVDNGERVWPQAELLPGQSRPDALLQVLDSLAETEDWDPTALPLTHLIMTSSDRAELAEIGDGPLDEALSNAQMNASFIRIDGRGSHIRYLVGVRNRGGASRIGPPNNFRVNFSHDRPWDEAIALNLNCQFVHSQIIGSAIYRLARIPAAAASPVRVMVNGVDAAEPAGPRMFGAYAQLEVINSDFPERHLADDPDGNLYRAFASGPESGDLRYEGPDPDAYRDTYSKETNDNLDDWSDLIRLTDVLNNAPDAEYFQQVNEVLDLQQWLRFLAMDALLGNRETGLSMGTGDNYWLYRGAEDARFRLLPHDLDTLMGRGRRAQPNRSIFTYTTLPAFQRMLSHPQIVPLYYQTFLDLISEVFNPQTLDPLIDQLLGRFVAEGEIAELKDYVARRVDGVLAQIPQEFHISSVLPLMGGYPRTTQPVTELVGTADAVQTKSVLVNGEPADWSAFTREWSMRSQGDGRTEILVAPGAEWLYQDDGSDLGTRWRTGGFDDAEWLRGTAPFGYGNGDEKTLLSYGPNPNDKYVTTYFRHVLSIAETDPIQDLTLRLQRDDGAIVYLNGVEVARSNMPDDPIDFQTVASSWVGGGLQNQFHSFTIDAGLLQSGENLLAVEVHQRSPIDSDLRFDLSLEATVGSTTGGVALRPGINRVTVQAFDGPLGTGQEIDRGFIDIWYDGAAGIDRPFCDQLQQETYVAPARLIGGVLDQDTTLAPCGPVYRVSGPVVVPTGVTLAILPGTTLLFDPGAEIRVEGGQLLAEGSPFAPIRFTRPPGSTAAWNGIQFVDSLMDNRLSHAVIEYAVTGQGMVGLERSRLLIDQVTFDHTDRFRIRTINSSLIVRNSVFTDIFPDDQPPTTDNQSEHIWGSGILAGGQLLIEGNRFGTTKGHNDAIDFDGAARPDPIPVIRENLFFGSGDDVLDLECDAHIEANVFQNVVKDIYNTATGDANAISAGAGRHFVVTRNVFHQVDHAVQVKDDAFLTFQHNTVFDAFISAIYFDLDERSPGRGALVEDSIFQSSSETFASVEDTTDLTVHRSLVSPAFLAYGDGNLAAPARFVDAAQADFRLRNGSPARESGQNGWDRGALVSAGVSVAGEPTPVTPLPDATLTVGGPGFTHYRYRINEEAWSPEIPLERPIALRDLPDGEYRVELVGKNSAAEWQPFDHPTRARSWKVDRGSRSLRINEVLAANLSAVNVAGAFPDLVELYHAGATDLDISGMSLTDDPNVPRKFVFPSGAHIDAGGFLVLSSGSSSTEYPWTLGFALRREGEGIYLFDAPERGGSRLDSLEFGLQLADFSLGRVGSDGRWQLTRPTLGGPNQAQPLGDPETLSINEWLTRGEVRVDDDYVELYNPDPLPVNLAGLSLTDDPASRPQRYTIAPHSYIAGNGYVTFRADRNVDQGVDHLPFRLAADQGQIALLNSDHRIIDQVLYHWQTIDVSEGRFPDGAPAIRSQALPTPAGANVVRESRRETVLSIDAPWRFDSSGRAPAADWKDPDFEDAAWSVGSGVLAAEDGELPAAIGTPLPLGVLAYYFRTTFSIHEPLDRIQLQLTTLIDDGAVFYLNGTEFLRLGMPEGTIDSATRSNRGVGNAVFEGPFVLPVDLLRPGENLLAVEVHQVSPTNSDIVFGAFLESEQDESTAAIDRTIALLDGLRITEVMYHPAGGGNTEFIELTNLSEIPLDLAGVRLEGGIDFTFGGSRLEPGDAVTVVGDIDAFRARYGASVSVAGRFSGALSNNSDQILLVLPVPYDVRIQQLEYRDSWQRRTDGEGFSLTLIDPQMSPRKLANESSWRRSREIGGSPGRDDSAILDFDEDGSTAIPDLQMLCDAVRTRTPDWKYDLDLDDEIGLHDVAWWLLQVRATSFGDANLDGLFDTADLVLVLERGQYESNSLAIAGWEDGDWDCDGRFTVNDLVLALQTGRYQG